MRTALEQEQRKLRILSWNKNPSLKPDSQAGRIINYLKKHKEATYSDLVSNDSYNYHRNIKNLRSCVRASRRTVIYQIKRAKLEDKFNSNGKFEEAVTIVRYHRKRYKMALVEYLYRKQKGEWFIGICPPEPNYSQVVADLWARNIIEKVKHGVYRLC